ncbi:MAG: hypothetical protein ACLU4J_03815 [Butyricimonas paravirosa]
MVSACLYRILREHNLQVDTPGWHWKIRLLNYREGTTLPVEFSSTQGVGTSEKDRNKRGFEIIECLHGSYSLNGNLSIYEGKAFQFHSKS